MWRRFKKEKFSPLIILIIASPLIIVPLRTNLLDLLRLPLTFGSLVLKEIRNFISYRAILNENISLKKKIDNLQREYIELKEESLEFERIENLLLFKKEKEKKYILCRVIARDPSNWYSSILIDKGRFQGIKEGDCVIGQTGLVGRIIEAGQNTSKVILITDPQFSCAALIQRSRQQGIVYGSLLNKLIFRFFDDNVDIERDDLVITSGLSTFAPKGILIGRITHIKSDSTSIEAEVLPSVELQKLEEVLVILRNTDEHR